MLPKSNTFVKGSYGQTNWIYFLIEGNVLLNKYNNIWDRVGSNIQWGFNNEPVYNFWKPK